MYFHLKTGCLGYEQNSIDEKFLGWNFSIGGVLGNRVFQDRNREMDHAFQLL